MPKTHGVVVIHGQGTAQYPGATLAQLLNSTIPSLEAGGYRVDREIELKASPPRASLTLAAGEFGAGSIDGDRVVLREAFWDDAFPPPSADDVAQWALMGLRERAGGMLHGWFRDPSTKRRRVWSWRDLWARIQIGFLVMALGAGLLLTTVIQPVGWVLLTLSKMPGLAIFGVTRRIAEAIRGLNPFLQHTLGDSQRLVTDRAWAATVRGRLEAPVLELLGRGDVEQVTIVAYSAGAMVSYDALLRERPIPRRARALNKRVRLVTVGAGVNHLWAFAKMNNNGIRERAELVTTPLDADLIALAATGDQPHDAFWTDLFARFDYVPAGVVAAEITALSGLERDGSFRGRRVINYDHLVDDHGGYFRNREQVISRVLPIAFGRADWAHQDASLEPAVGAREDDDRRLTSVFWLTTARMLPFYTGGLHALLYLFDAPGWRDLTFAVGAFLRGLPGVAGTSDVLASRLVVDPRHAAALLVVGSSLFLLARALYSWWRPKVDDEGLCWPQGRHQIARSASRLRTRAANAPTNSAIFGLLIAIVLWAGGVPRLSALVLVVLALVAVLIAFRYWWQDRFASSSLWSPLRGTFWAPVLAVSFVVAIVAFIWIPARIEDGAFTVSLDAKSNNVEVLWADSGTVLLSGGSAEKHGLLALRWEDRRVLLGPVISSSDGAALRCLLPGERVASASPPVGPARVESEAYFAAPASADRPDSAPMVGGIRLREVVIGAPSGQRPAYLAGGSEGRNATGRDWAILVHGKGGTREEGLRVLPALRALDLTVLSISYRNDPESILGERVEYDYGRSEWEDLAAAVEYARERGAERIVLFGYSMGGGVVANYLIETDRAGDRLPDAVVLDAPMLDLEATIAHGIAPTPVLGWFDDALAWAAEQRLRRDFDSAVYLERLVDLTEEHALPTLIFHQRGDHRVPFATSERAAEDSSQIALGAFDAPGHTRAWNDDPRRYEGELTSFLGREFGLGDAMIVSAQTQAVLDAPCGSSTVGELIDVSTGTAATLVAR